MTGAKTRAVAACLTAYDAQEQPERATERQAVKDVLTRLTEVAPGNSVEVRIPPYAAVQAVAGIRHRRGTPPASVECDARTWLEVATGRLTWADAVAAGRIFASGERSDLAALMPLV